MTISISKTKRIDDYYLSPRQHDYYLSRDEPPSLWLGAGAERLGLRGAVDQDSTHNLLNGYTPDGKQPLIQRKKHRAVRSGRRKARQHQLGKQTPASDDDSESAGPQS